MDSGLVTVGVLMIVFGLFFWWAWIIGFGILVLGLIVVIAGLATSEEKKSQPQPTAPVLVICPQCKNRIPNGTNFCPICGTDLRPKNA